MPFSLHNIPWNKGRKCPGLGGRPPGGIPWNKGKKHPAAVGNKFACRPNSTKKNTGNRRAQLLLREPKPCKKCKQLKTRFQMIRHHKDGNPLNNKKRNIVFLCRSCHINLHRKELLNARKFNTRTGPGQVRES